MGLHARMQTDYECLNVRMLGDLQCNISFLIPAKALNCLTIQMSGLGNKLSHFTEKIAMNFFENVHVSSILMKIINT